jgi:polygalacturonase
MRASFVALGDNSTVRADSVRRPRWTRRRVLAHIGAAAAMMQVPLSFAQPARRRFSENDFHALGDGIALDTAPIQRAIDAASSIGGGFVWFGPGRYITGTLLLKTGVMIRGMKRPDRL